MTHVKEHRLHANLSQKRPARKPLPESNHHERDLLPVFKINFEGEVVYANPISQQLFSELCVPGELMENSPWHQFLRKRNRNGEAVISTPDLDIYFSVVPFDEAGYIGFYAWQIKSKL